MRDCRALLVRLGSVPERFHVDGGRLGSVVLETIGLALPPTPVRPEQEESFALDTPSGVVRAVVDGHLALLLVAKTLGMAPPRVLRRPGPAERGALAALLLTALRGCGMDARVALSLGGPAPDLLVGLRFRVRAAGACGTVELQLPAGYRPGRSAGPPAERLSALSVIASIELARTSMRRELLAAAAPGDAVVFDCPAAQRGVDDQPGWAAALRIGAWCASCVLTSAGELRLLAGFERADDCATPAPRGRRKETSMESNATAPLTDLLASAPVEIVAELGRLTLRGDEVLSLLPGSVLALPAAPCSAEVQLRVGGRVWAKGELVDVEGDLGVRITELCPSGS